jgi:hypothetical protein
VPILGTFLLKKTFYNHKILSRNEERAVYLWFEASPYIGIGYRSRHAEGGHKVTERKK